MAGTLFSLPLSQQFDGNGDPYIGALLYVYLANTSTPSQTYADFGLTILNPFPLTTDASGRIPVFWVADGLYRARLTDAGGVEIFDIAVIQSIGPSTGGSGGGGGGSVDATTVFQTGDPLWVPISGIRTGWVRLNARTISSGLGAGTERADADTLALFEYNWNAYDDTLCPVLPGGRGATALIDFNAGKTLGLLDMKGYGPFGLDNMGSGSAAGRIVGGTPDDYGTSGGDETVTLVTNNIPVLPFVGAAVPNHTHGPGSGVRFFNSSLNTVPDGAPGTGLDGVGHNSGSLALTTAPDGGHTPTGTVNAASPSTPVNKMPPYRLGTWYQKL